MLDKGQFIHLNFLERDNYQKFLDFLQLSKWSKPRPLVSGYDAYYQELSTYAPKEFIEDYNQKIFSSITYSYYGIKSILSENTLLYITKTKSESGDFNKEAMASGP